MRERETKFDVAEDFDLPSFESVLRETSVKLTATYWDTPDRRLGRWGHTLRHREASDGSERGWTLKLSGPPGAQQDAVLALDRTELHLPGPDAAPPVRASGLLLGVLRGARLAPVATVETDRRALELGADGRVGRGTVELVDDRVSSTVDGEPGAVIRQIEVEVKDPRSDELLSHVWHRLFEAGATPTSDTKLDVVLGGKARPQIGAEPLGHGSTIGTAVRSAIATSVVGLIRRDPAIRLDGDPDAVHDARVATRRLRSDLKTLEPLLDPSRVEPLRRELAWVGGALGAVRDLDVLTARVEGLTSRLPQEDQEGSAALVAALGAERRARFRELVDVLRSARYIDLLDALVATATHPPLTPSVRDRPARSELRKLVRKAWRRTAGAVARLNDHPSEAQLHEIRKRAKRARYACELGGGVLGKRASRLARRLAELQDQLGELQDTVVADGTLRSLARSRITPGSAFVAGTVASLEREHRARARERWPDAWRTARTTRPGWLR